jgi:hypothetical protein
MLGKQLMTFTKTILLASTIFLCNACTPKEVPVHKGGYYYDEIYFGADLTDAYKKGINDGCTTSKGKYKKSHWFFQNKKDYVDGWFLGRNKCRDLLKIDENGDLIL